jgi:endoglucanase
VDAGARTFKWTYSKDGSSSEGSDAAWIDDIVFPATGGEASPPEAPFKRGVNLTGWLQYVSNARQIQFTKFTKQDLINIKSLGCDVIRLPIDLRAMTSGAPDYTIDPLFYYFLDQIIDWAEGLELHLILDNHFSYTDATGNTSSRIGDILVPVWTQMAQHYKDRSTYVYYEVLNEPHGISDTAWNQIQQRVIDAIRAVDQEHTIIIGPSEYNSCNNLKFMPEYEDDNLIYTFHFYDPFVFTHQGATWTDPSLEPLAGVPFPYYAGDIPACPSQLENTWVRSNLTEYRNSGTVGHVKELIDIAVDFQTRRHVPLFCGEFGVYKPNSNNENRIYWYNLVRSYLEQKGIAWTIWDYKGGFGLFEQGTGELFDHDLNVPLVRALGFVAPPQKRHPDVNGFDLYLDDTGPNVIESSWISNGILDYYSENNPASGNYCIHWTGADLYNMISFRFSPVKDLSVLVDKGFALDFWVRCNDPSAKISIGFADTKTGDRTDHPWHIRYTIDRNVADWNGQWNHLQIPLNAFFEIGSYDDGWFDPRGAYDWTATDRFEIVAEFHDLVGIHFYFDDIRVVDPDTFGRP